METSDEDRCLNEPWTETKQILLDTAKVMVGLNKCNIRKTWIFFDGTFELVRDKKSQH
jgi:hypothetical protein